MILVTLIYVMRLPSVKPLLLVHFSWREQRALSDSPAYKFSIRKTVTTHFYSPAVLFKLLASLPSPFGSNFSFLFLTRPLFVSTFKQLLMAPWMFSFSFSSQFLLISLDMDMDGMLHCVFSVSNRV